MIHLIKKIGSLIAKGFCMGAADIVPGVSGGTMAFILGIYEELIDSIADFGTRNFFRRLPFLVPVGAGILLAIALLSIPLEYVLASYPAYVWSFFFGLVLASVFVVSKRIRTWSIPLILTLVLGVIIAYRIVGLVPVATPETPLFLIFSGAIAICAMILPGVSGAFLLVLLGKYEFILSAVNERDFMTIFYVGIGALIGIVLFARVLKWLFDHYHDLTVTLLIGLMIGSLRKIWPMQYSTSEDTLFPLILCVILGALLVSIIEFLAHRKTT